MKRFILIALLCTLAVMTFLITTSCNPGTSSGAPPKEPGHYIKVGRSFQKITDESMFNSMGMAPEEFAQKAISIPAGCTTIEYACRLTPTQARDALSGGFFAQGNFEVIGLISAITRSDPRDQTRIIVSSESWVGASDAEDHSQYRAGDTYILLSFKLPASPEGKYFLRPYEGGVVMALQRNK